MNSDFKQSSSVVINQQVSYTVQADVTIPMTIFTRVNVVRYNLRMRSVMAGTSLHQVQSSCILNKAFELHKRRVNFLKMGSGEKCVVSITVLILLYLPYQRQNPYEADLERVLHGLLVEESFRKIDHRRHRVAIGFGSCLDIFADGIDLLDELQVPHPEISAHHDVISSEATLAESFAYYFRYGAAAE